jgi:SLOG cluster4 family
VIAVGGSWGTQSEIALAMRSGTPVAVINGWPVQIPAGSSARALPAVTSAEAAVTAIFAALGR